MSTVPESRPVEDQGRSILSVALFAHPHEHATLERPPIRPDLHVLRPMLRLPTGMRICVDHTATDADAARWWSNLAVQATYAALWHQNRDHTGPAPRTPTTGS